MMYLSDLKIEHLRDVVFRIRLPGIYKGGMISDTIQNVFEAGVLLGNFLENNGVSPIFYIHTVSCVGMQYYLEFEFASEEDAIHFKLVSLDSDI